MEGEGQRIVTGDESGFIYMIWRQNFKVASGGDPPEQRAQSPKEMASVFWDREDH